jgi:hypothetical protein
MVRDLKSWQPVLEWLCSRGCDVPQGLDRGVNTTPDQPKTMEQPKVMEQQINEGV